MILPRQLSEAASLTLLGSTGSIGESTLALVREIDNLSVFALSANTNAAQLLAQCREFSPRYAVLADSRQAAWLAAALADADCGTELLVGAEALDEVAGRWGLERFEARDEPFAPDAFADAELVVGAHGAALAGLAFCTAGTAVVEIMPDHHRFPYYASLACSGGLRYTAVPGTPVVDERHAHFTVDPEELDAAIDLVMS